MMVQFSPNEVTGFRRMAAVKREGYLLVRWAVKKLSMHEGARARRGGSRECQSFGALL